MVLRCLGAYVGGMAPSGFEVSRPMDLRAGETGDGGAPDALIGAGSALSRAVDRGELALPGCDGLGRYSSGG